MRMRALGRSGLHVPCICFGAYALGGGYWGAQDEGEAVRAVERALDLGMHAFDTAPVYGFGRSEQLLGRALRGRRAQALVLGKVGLRWDLADARGRRTKTMLGPDGEPREVACDSRPASVRAEVEASLQRLRCEQLDLVQVHARDPLTPVAETMGALEELRTRGLVRAIGLSNYTLAESEEARRALAPSPLASLQLQYSLLARGIERELAPWALAQDVGVLAYAPLDQGLLSGKVGPERRFEAGTGRARRPSFAPQNRACDRREHCRRGARLDRGATRNQRGTGGRAQPGSSRGERARRRARARAARAGGHRSNLRAPRARAGAGCGLARAAALRGRAPARAAHFAITTDSFSELMIQLCFSSSLWARHPKTRSSR